jgi:hypothetical protein
MDFMPQFHRRATRSDGRRVWIAVPHPKTLVPEKTHYYRDWQREERLRLQNAGEHVLGFPTQS